MSYPVEVGVTFDFSNGPIFGYPFILDDPKNGVLGKGTLGTTIPKIVDISNQVTKIDLSGGYNLLQDQFQAGQATIRIIDPNGDWNPMNPASIYYPDLVPLRKIRVSGTYAGVQHYIFSGYVTNYAYSYPKNQDFGYVDITAIDGFRLFNLASVSTISGGTAGQTPGDRINAILSDIQWPNGMREIATTSTTTVQADTGATRTALEAIKMAELAEQGGFYMDGEGDAVFKSRAWLMAQSGKDPVYFSNDGTGITYKDIKFAYDDKLIINETHITRAGGTEQVAESIASQAQYFPHTFSQTNVIVQTDSQAKDIAANYTATRAFTTIRIDAMTLDLTTPDYAIGIEAALKGDYFQTFSIKNVGPDGTVILKVLQVVGIAHTITPQTWNTTFTTSEPIVGSFILNSSLYGKIDDTNSVLGY